jgi:hypothetical protein
MTDTTAPTDTQRPAPERLLGVRLAATDEGGAQMTTYTRAADGTLYEGALTMEPHVADMLRQAVLREIPDRPQPKATAAVLHERMEGWFAPAPAATTRPLVVCICGSTRFMDLMTEADWQETAAGRIVVKPGCDMKTPHPLWADPADAEKLKARLDELHRAKLRMADEVLVVGDYIGESTRAEIAYARSLGLPVRFTHPDVDA